MSGLTGRVENWRRLGERAEFRGHGIHLHRRAGGGPLLLFLHGFPSSSYDWRFVLERETGRAALAPDFLGFGLSDKPRDHDYTLGWQADLVEELVRRHSPGESVFLVAHDMGTSVATELMARDLEGRDSERHRPDGVPEGAGGLSFRVAGVFLFNGSMLQHLAAPTLAQKLLRGPLGPLMARLTSERFFRQQFGSIFSPGHPLSDEEAADQWALIRHNGGHRLGHRLIEYMEERYRHAERWNGAIRDWPGRLSFAWGMLDPVARVEVLEGLRELRPAAPVTELADLGHYPQIEDPERLIGAMLQAVAAAA